ncbi:MAG: hypothetical protein A2V21_312040 [Deltaproteobacteria bacterium GWC2_55_46]|nr:MAG: hypothetical protein A2Z79_11795 [Deltaproteobacteria bacterium GWA2_55_82]OGQ63550.1 MAG: hypothetical protein A3I81_05985 [Deltaproteobacteria bacterium RIFCSPLOWO2_02_FULL_55_12]OIJ74931.1 MAG: hypothetical protein A2V21_312040 [Deltaproteobacteria bacterium GWC2_55_46]
MVNGTPILERAFSHIEIGIHKYCNSKCPFCPHGQEESSSMPKGAMSEELYLKVLGDLKEMGFCGRISFHLMNEPLLSKNLVRFVRLAREYCNDACILIITNGSVLSYRYLVELFENGADRIAINHYSKARKRLVFPLINALASVVKMSRRNAVLHRWSSVVFLGTYYLLTLDDTSKKYLRIFFRLESERMARVSFSITRFYTNYTNRAGNLKTKVLKEPLKEFCIYPFVQMYITYDGKAVICSADYFHKEVVGDVETSSLLEIWNSRRYKMIRSKLFRGDRGGLICEQCDTFFLYEPDLYYPVPGDR